MNGENEPNTVTTPVTITNKKLGAEDGRAMLNSMVTSRDKRQWHKDNGHKRHVAIHHRVPHFPWCMNRCSSKVWRLDNLRKHWLCIACCSSLYTPPGTHKSTDGLFCTRSSRSSRGGGIKGLIRQSNTRSSPSRLRSRNSQRSTDHIASCFNIFTREKYHYYHPIHICLGYPLIRTTCIHCTGTTVQ